MRIWTWLVAVALGIGVAGLAAPSPACADSSQAVQEVVDALGLTSEPADYVVLVDTSGSMNAGGRYTSVRQELATLVDGLDHDDRVSLITFDATAEPRFRGTRGNNRAAVLAGLPATAGGLHTDIGAAIDAGLAELEREDTHRLAALILITDGKLDAPGSPYATVKSAAWKRLKSRASALAGDHEVAAYAVSLQASTDAALLKKVFPRASEVDAAAVGARFAEVGGDLVRLQAAAALKTEVSKAIQVTWRGDLGASLASGAPVDVELDLTSPYPHVPVQLSNLKAVATDGVEVRLSGLPAKVVLDPGATVTVTARAQVSGPASGAGSVTLAGTVSSPWRKVMEKELGLSFAPALSGSTSVPAAPISLPPTLLPLAGGIAALLFGAALVLLVARMLLTPSMNGVLSFRKDGREVGEIVLSGRRMKLVPPEAATELVGLTGTAAGARGSRGSERAVRLDLHFGAAGARGLVNDGASTSVGDFVVTFVSGRRRILDKIGVPRAEAVTA